MGEKVKGIWITERWMKEKRWRRMGFRRSRQKSTGNKCGEKTEYLGDGEDKTDMKRHKRERKRYKRRGEGG